VSRPAFARVLLKHIESPVEKIVIPRADLTPVLARQIRSFDDAALTQKLTEVWGEVRESGADQQQLIATLKAKLTPEFLRTGDARQGRVIFGAVCAACHKLYGEGHTLGPDLTGSGRHDIGYLIENIADPSAVVAAENLLTVLTLKDGRVLNGLLRAQTERTVTVRMMEQETRIDRAAIAKQEQLPVSMMPEGLLTALTDDQVRHLIAYLQTTAQVPLPK
jgi:putative heme-binding domain-containing protein